MRLILAIFIALAAGCTTPAPASIETPAATPTARVTLIPPVTTTPAPTATPFACPAVEFCYERLEVFGEVEPYTDVTGREEIGTGIRSLPGFPLFFAAHAYTQFGRIRDWRIGDVVIAYGHRYTVYDALQARCSDSTVEQLIAQGYGPVFMQTSLGTGCGAVLVVVAR